MRNSKIAQLRLKIVTPTDLTEQRKIAAILSTVDEKIEVIDEQLAEAEQLKKGLMHRLLTKGIGHTEFKETKIGIIPKEWEVKTLEEIASDSKYAIVDGPFGSNLKTEHYRKEGIPIIQSGFVTSNIFIADSYLYVDEEKFKSEIRSKVIPGDIIMAKIGVNYGKCAILPENHPIGILAGNSLKISIAEDNSRFFYLHLLQYYNLVGRMAIISTKTAQPALSISALKKLLVPFPKLDEQKKIAEILSNMDEKLDVLREKKEECQVLKKGLMQKLLSGEIRVNTGESNDCYL